MRLRNAGLAEIAARNPPFRWLDDFFNFSPNGICLIRKFAQRIHF
jgi:hypothetical protein